MNCRMEYTLIQQTPIIHFQHDQKGATLRATEVKPKLDKFIVNKLGGKDNVPKNWFIADTKALNYKLRIVTTGEPRRSKMIEAEIEHYRANQRNADRNTLSDLKDIRNKEINSMYFGNMVGMSNEYEENVRNSYKETVFYEGKEQIKLEIVCFVEELRQEIENYIEEFFFVNNFGTRQSKGFGGFVAIKKGEEHKATDPIKTLSEQGYRFFYAEVKGDTSYTAMLNHAKNVYAVMKGGYNDTRWNENEKKYRFPLRYVKGYIQRDFLDDFNWNDKGSDKACIKSKKEYVKDKTTKLPYQYPLSRKGQPDEYRYNKYKESEENYFFVRALLGLADYYEFKDNSRYGRVDIFSLGENGFDVERFRSPVTIKIFGSKLLFLFGSFNEICGKTFYFAPNGIPYKYEFDKKIESEKAKYIANNPNVFVKIFTPEKFDDDDVVKFINNFVDYFTINKSKLNNFKKKQDGKFIDTDISISSSLTLIVPEHIERRV